VTGRRRSARDERLLKRLDAKHRGRLLIPSAGTNREFTFFPAMLARLEPDLFHPVEDLEPRVEELVEAVAELRAAQRQIARAVGDNTRALSLVADVLERRGPRRAGKLKAKAVAVSRDTKTA